MNTLLMLMSSLRSAGRITRQLRHRVSTFAKTESGATAAFIALSAPVWIGGIALGAEVGNWYYQKQRLQSTADMLASGIAGRVGTGASQSELNTLTTFILTQNQFDSSRGVASVTVSQSSSAFANGDTVNVQLTRSMRPILTAMFRQSNFVLQANAVAQVTQATEGCILASNVSATGLNLESSARVQVTGCEVLSNGNNLWIQGGSNLTTNCARSRDFVTRAGTLAVTACSYPQGQQQAGITVDPYASLSDISNAPPGCSEKVPGPTTITSNGDWNGKLTPTPINGRNYVRICSTLIVAGTVPVNVPGWTFVFSGATTEFQITNTVVTSTDSPLFYFEGGARANVNAPASSVRLAALPGQSGMIMRGARTNTLGAGVNNVIIVGPNSDLQGAVYFPASPIQFQANGNVSSCIQIIGSTVILRGGNWRMTGPCTTSGLLSPMVASKAVQLTQ